jgi:hypothetical protein
MRHGAGKLAAPACQTPGGIGDYALHGGSPSFRPFPGLGRPVRNSAFRDRASRQRDEASARSRSGKGQMLAPAIARLLLKQTDLPADPLGRDRPLADPPRRQLDRSAKRLPQWPWTSTCAASACQARPPPCRSREPGQDTCRATDLKRVPALRDRAGRGAKARQARRRCRPTLRPRRDGCVSCDDDLAGGPRITAVAPLSSQRCAHRALAPFDALRKRPSGASPRQAQSSRRTGLAHDRSTLEVDATLFEGLPQAGVGKLA